MGTKQITPEAIGAAAFLMQQFTQDQFNPGEAASEALPAEGLAGWSRNQLRSLDSGDLRRHKRFETLLTQMASNPQGSLPMQCGSSAAIKGAYRALAYPEITASDLMASHRAATLAHLEAQPPADGVLLNVQDTTTLNFTTHLALSGQGSIGKKSKSGTTGFHAHGTLLLGANGYVYGMLDSEIYARDDAALEARRQGGAGKRNREKAEDKESARWLRSLRRSAELAATRAPDSLTVNVADREADMYELFLLANELRAVTPQLHLLVRSQHNRKLHGEEGFLHETLAVMPAQATWEIELPAAKGLKSQIRTVECVWREVTVEVPAHQRKYQGHTLCQKLWAIEVREPNPPEGAEALHWVLLSTRPVTDEKGAREVIGWYVQRWQIEVLHRTWKTGCKVEDRRVQDPQTMLRLIMLDLMVAVQLLSLVKAARLTPDAPASNLLSAAQCECLAAYAASCAPALKPSGTDKGDAAHATDPPDMIGSGPDQARQQPPGGEAQLMTIVEAVKYIALLGGYRGNMKKRPPGAEVLWRGIQRLSDLTTGWLLAKTEKSG